MRYGNFLLIEMNLSCVAQEVQGNKERCNAIISIVTQYAYTVIECLAELYTVEGEHRLEAVKGELRSFQR